MTASVWIFVTSIFPEHEKLNKTSKCFSMKKV
jgi:hypothetical protein